MKKHLYKGQNNWKEITGKDVKKCADSAIIQPLHHEAGAQWAQTSIFGPYYLIAEHLHRGYPGKEGDSSF